MILQVHRDFLNSEPGTAEAKKAQVLAFSGLERPQGTLGLFIIPGRGGALAPQPAQRGRDLVAGHRGELPARAKLGGQAVERAGVGPPRVRVAHPGRGQERIGGLGEGDRGAADRGEVRRGCRGLGYCHGHWPPCWSHRSLRAFGGVWPSLSRWNPPAGYPIFSTPQMPLPVSAYWSWLMSLARASSKTIVIVRFAGMRLRPIGLGTASHAKRLPKRSRRRLQDQSQRQPLVHVPEAVLARHPRDVSQNSLLPLSGWNS